MIGASAVGQPQVRCLQICTRDIVSLHYYLFFKFHILTYVYSQKEIANITSLLPLLLVNSA
jgi:hypothetical protein